MKTSYHTTIKTLSLSDEPIMNALSSSSSSTQAAASAAPLTASTDFTPDSIVLYRYMRVMSSHDWNYPISFCGGIYRTRDMFLLMSQIMSLKGEVAMNHPNIFEVTANELAVKGISKSSSTSIPSSSSNHSVKNTFPVVFGSLCGQRGWTSFPSYPCTSVLTINRVQDIYKNPIFPVTKFEHQGVTLDDGQVENLLKLFQTLSSSHEREASQQEQTGEGKKNVKIDQLNVFHLPKYQSNCHQFHSVHIGNVYLKELS